jgi:hypothetical protein
MCEYSNRRPGEVIITNITDGFITNKPTSSSKMECLHIIPTQTNFLNEQFPDKSIGTEGHLTWPPRSQDLTPPDFELK